MRRLLELDHCFPTIVAAVDFQRPHLRHFEKFKDVIFTRIKWNPSHFDHVGVATAHTVTVLTRVRIFAVIPVL